MVMHGSDTDSSVGVFGSRGCMRHWTLDCMQDFMSETEQEIETLKKKLTERDTRISALEKELADCKARQFPTFITQSTFVQRPA